jgi:TolB-like protein/Tfp pilus assembly protein PilF
MSLHVEEQTHSEFSAGKKLGPEPHRASRSRLPIDQRWKALNIILLLTVAAALGLGLWSLSRKLAPQITAPVSPDFAYMASFAERSIAVLPFDEPGGVAEDVSLSEAVQDDILHALSKVADLRVISRTSVANYPPGNARNLRTIAQDLGAGHILEGSVSRIDDKVRITVHLTDARRGVRLLDTTYERDLAEVFGAQSELVVQIAAQLHATVSDEEGAAINERPTQDLVAYALYVRGKTLIESVGNAQVNEKLLKATELLEQAIDRDQNFYLAWCQLGAAHNYIYFFGFDHSANRLASAQAALDTVIRLRPDAGETHLAKANFLYRCYLDYDKARAELALAKRALPNQSEVYELTGYIDRRQGLWPESARSLQRALELDPRNSFLLQQIAASYQEFRQFGAMAAALDRALALTPDDLDARVTRAFVDLEWRADTRPLHETIDAFLKNPDSAADLADQWLYVSLCERDWEAAARAVAAVPATGISTDIIFPRTYCQALAARASGDAAGAQTAFLAARAELEEAVRQQPDYGENYTVLGLIDAGLGRKENAIREGRRGVELLPITRNSIDGAELMKYLAVIYAWCGEKDLAIEQIQATLRVPSSLSYGNLKLHPYWDALRGEPRFEQIVADLAPKN